MKQRYVKLISAFVCIAIMLTTVIVTRTELHGASSDTVLFYNDKAWTLSNRLPAEQVHSVYYVPISFLVQLPSVDVRMNEALRTFVISHGDLYLSFDISTDFAANQDKERMYIKTAEYHSERYVPVRTVCAYLDLGYEELVNDSTGAVAIRVTDGNHSSTLGELTKLRYPSLFPEVSDTDSNTVDNPTSDTTTPDSDQDPILSDRTIYITIDSISGAYTDSILATLKRYGYSATFFISADTVKSNASLLSKIAAGGHEIALSVDGQDEGVLNEATLLSDINRQNALLARLIKKKAHIWRASDEYEITDEVSKALEDRGYFEWGYDLDIPQNFRASTAATTAISAIRANKVVTLRFKDSRNTAESLRLILDFIKNNRSACEVRTASLAFCKTDTK